MLLAGQLEKEEGGRRRGEGGGGVVTRIQVAQRQAQGSASKRLLPLPSSGITLSGEGHAEGGGGGGGDEGGYSKASAESNACQRSWQTVPSLIFGPVLLHCDMAKHQLEARRVKIGGKDTKGGGRGAHVHSEVGMHARQACKQCLYCFFVPCFCIATWEAISQRCT